MRPLAWLLSLLWLVGTACSEDGSPSPRNQCSGDGDCAANASCDTTRNQCIVSETPTPYTVVLQVATPSARDGELKGHTFDAFELTKSDALYPLSIPAGLSLKGIVGWVDEEETKPVRAQLVFEPEAARGLPVAAVRASSRDRLEDNQNFSVTLTPNTRYTVTVYPLGAQSRRFPPLVTQRNSAELSADTPLELMYPTLESFSGFLRDEKGAPLTGRWVRIVEILDGKTRVVVSSIGVVGDAGELRLWVNPDVLARKSYVFEVDLDDQNAWATVIEADDSHVDASRGNTITLPVVPGYVRFQGTVDKSTEKASRFGTDLTFVSEFPVPSVPGEVGGRDFCRATLLSDTKTPFHCRSTRQGTTDDEGRFSVTLLPGDYRVFLSPTRDTQNSDRATTLAATAVIETQPAGAPQQGQLYMLATGSRYRGAVRTTDGKGLDNVLVRAVALGLPGYLGDVAAYNRTSEAVTSTQGGFELPVDVGFYDLVARPAENVGYPWMYVANLPIKVRDETINVSGFILPTPLLLAGTLARGGLPQAAASVDAYALVQELDGGKRAVLIGQTTTDEQGNYSLLLTSEVTSADAPPQGLDAGSE